MPLPNFHSFRIETPQQYDTFRYKKTEKGVDFVIGKNKDGKMEIQAVRFDKNEFTFEQAKKWIQDHDMHPIKQEPAKNETTVLKTFKQHFNES